MGRTILKYEAKIVLREKDAITEQGREKKSTKPQTKGEPQRKGLFGM